MLTPEYLQRCSEGAEHIASQLHTNMLKQITRRIQARQAKGYDYILTSTDKWAIESLMDAGYLREDLMQEIAQANNLQAQEMRSAFLDAGVKTTKYDDRIYKAAGIEATDFSRSPYFQRILQREYEATMGTWDNVTRTTADAAQQTFIQTMDAVHYEVLSGSASYTQAYTNAINRLAQDGLSITYPSGHVDTIEVAALRCVRTGVSQASAEIGLARMDEYGVDLVVVSSHMGARPSHAVWQGKIYSRSGKRRKYPEFAASTGYGTGEGLCGWNCRHNFSPYFEGMDNPFEEYDSEENEEQYKKEQKQRSMERAIRKSKREVDVLSDAVEHAQDEESKDTLINMRERAKTRLKGQNKAYNAYCEEYGLRPLRERLKIGRAGMDNGMDIAPAVVVPSVPQKPPAFDTPLTKSADPQYDNLLKRLSMNKNIAFVPFKYLQNKESADKIIEAIGGGDMTNGSCASCGLAYIGRVNGYDVRDFRGGNSQGFFSGSMELNRISKAQGMKTITAEGASSTTVGNRLLHKCEEGKEYYLCVGRHAAIVRVNGGEYEYLELQSNYRNGWKPFGKDTRRTLNWRFGCSSQSDWGFSERHDFMIDINDSDFDTDEFRSLIGYINTEVGKQVKGTSGTIK